MHFNEVVPITGGHPLATGIGVQGVTVMDLLNDAEGDNPNNPQLNSLSSMLEEIVINGSDKRILSQYAQYYYVANTDYKFLTSPMDSYRKKFISGLKGIKKKISQMDEASLDDGGKYDKLYKSTMLNYIDKIIDLNVNYNDSIKELYSELDKIKKFYK